MQEIQTLQSWIRDSQNIVFFGGAGVSTESNIPDFRSAGRICIINLTNIRPKPF